MGKPTGFIEIRRRDRGYVEVGERVKHYHEFVVPLEDADTRDQAARCMDCGIPFCHNGCPVNNIIPEWNDLVYQDRWREALAVLHSTNNFPEFTGRVCPAPCEASCTLNLDDEPVTIKTIECAIVDRGWDEGWIEPQVPARRTGKRVAVIGSGPAGLATAQQLTRAGHDVEVLEREDRIGGLLRYGIPEFKMEKRVLDRRLEQMVAEGVEFQTNANVGENVDINELQESYDAILLAGGSTVPRDLPVPGRELNGIHFAMDFLNLQNRRCEGDVIEDEAFISAEGKHVVIIGGGDTGADCLGTSHRQKAQSIRQLEIMPKPPQSRAENNPWPEWPHIYRVASAHEEGGDRVYSVSTKRFIDDGNGNVKGLELVEVEQKMENGRPTFVEVDGSAHEIPCDIAFLSMGFVGPQKTGMLETLGVALTDRGNVARDENWMTSVDGVFTAGDMQRGQSLIVWAIAEGRAAAASIDKYLMGATDLPAPLK